MFSGKNILKTLPTLFHLHASPQPHLIFTSSSSPLTLLITPLSRLEFSVCVKTNATYKFHEKSRFMQKLINKKGPKTKKQWYKPHLGEPLEVESKKTRRGISHSHSVRLRQLSHVLYGKIIEIINTGELSQELLERQVSITAVKMSKDMNNVNVYWEADRTDWREVEHLLFAHSGRLRSLLISYHVLGRIPHIVFVRDKSAVNLHQLTELFEKADYGPDYVPGAIHSDNDIDQDEDLESVEINLDNLRIAADSQDLVEMGKNSESYSYNSQISRNFDDNNINLNLKSEQYNLKDSSEIIMDSCNSAPICRVNMKSSSEPITNLDLNFRSDMYGLDRDSMMKKILAKKSKYSHKNNNSSLTTPINGNGNDEMISIPELDIDPKEVPSFISPTMTKMKLLKKRARQERRLYEKMLERDSVDF